MTAVASAGSSSAAFRALAGEILNEYLAFSPVTATTLGDHRFDDRLEDRSPDGVRAELVALRVRLAALNALDVSELDVADRVDRDTLAGRLAARAFDLSELREHEWNPMHANPGNALHLLLARDYAPLPDRLRALRGRLAAVPAALAQSRATLGDLPEVHLETAIEQFAGTRTLLATEVERALRKAGSAQDELEPVLDVTTTAIEKHLAWLTERRDEATGDPRLGPELFARQLGLTLDTASTPDEVLVRAEAELVRIEEEIAEVAVRLDGGAPRAGQVREVLDRLAEERPDNETIVALAAATLAETREFVLAHELITVHDDPVEIVVMPEIHRGVAVAYCQPSGPLETAPLPTFYAISPTPAGWPPERVESFFREYNVHMIRNLTIHEAMPGHVLQFAHARRFAATTPVRAAFWSGPFVEGWAVYAEELMVEHGFGGDAVRMQQLKMQLRMTINAILDVRVHTRDMTYEEAMRLMVERGHQEEGEAVGKWRRALLTSTQLSTYFVGYTEVAEVADRLAAEHPGWSTRQRHDTLLAHGSPPPRHLAPLLGLQPPG
ncbi:MAG: DUF885 domain-containing protein [Pseudonocardiaceae bacterium]